MSHGLRVEETKEHAMQRFLQRAGHDLRGIERLHVCSWTTVRWFIAHYMWRRTYQDRCQ